MPYDDQESPGQAAKRARLAQKARADSTKKANKTKDSLAVEKFRGRLKARPAVKQQGETQTDPIAQRSESMESVKKSMRGADSATLERFKKRLRKP